MKHCSTTPILTSFVVFISALWLFGCGEPASLDGAQAQTQKEALPFDPVDPLSDDVIIPAILAAQLHLEGEFRREFDKKAAIMPYGWVNGPVSIY